MNDGDKLSLDVRSQRSLSSSPGALTPYQPERQHDWVRLIVTLGLLAAFCITVFWALRQSSAAATVQWSQTKEVLQIVLPAITGLLGSVIGFYFGSGGRPKSL